MAKILRHVLPVIAGDQVLSVGHIVHVACRDMDSIEVWASSEDPAPRRFQVIGTGQPIPYGYEHVGTVISLHGALVWHLFGQGR